MNVTNSRDYFIPVYSQPFPDTPPLSSKTDHFGAKEIKSLATQTSMYAVGLLAASHHTSTNQNIFYFAGVMGSSFLINATTQVAKKNLQLTNKEAASLEAFAAGCSAPAIAAATIGLPLSFEKIAAVSALTGLALGGSTYIAHSIYESYYPKNKHRSSTELSPSSNEV